MRIRKTAATAAAAAALAAGFVAAGPASSASATSYVCTVLSSGADSSQCSHTSTLYANNSEWQANTRWNSAFTYLQYQSDGNLVLYCKNGGYSYGLGRDVNAGQAVWASGFVDEQSGNLHVMDFWNDGNLATYGINEETGIKGVQWSMNQWHGADSELIVQTDGNLVLWEDGTPYWASNTYHDCPGSQDFWNGYK
ncbi:hypothetical protein [Streptacidiphilus sp. P02-A3a]|uniref:hypothetical protein n=1 Tax=Streptacidiphilus sp. P02-A3a TaxID=2704468 RepID=UPI0015FD2B22|nr:hypothetical protein [Streptacidiphilus sp. P02-A3a]QMU67176.1 hypothetical protein GXP74_02075 [Streptacidiphilus sp. P02-A3a]